MTQEELINRLEKEGYTDGVDVNTEISLFDYGIIRNPKTNHVIYCIEDEPDHSAFDWSSVSLEDVTEALDNIDEGYFSFVGQSKDDILSNLSNDYLASEIHSINQYNGYFQDSCNWNYTIDTIL